MTHADSRRSDHGRERRHGRNRSDSERSDVTDRSRSRGQRERWQYAEEMRAAGNAVENSHAERGVRMTETPRPCRPRVDVHVIVRNRPVVVSAGCDVQRTSECPEADPDQGDADDPFTPRGEKIDRRQQIAQHDGQQRDRNHA